jgi:predicted Zn-dependent protease
MLKRLLNLRGSVGLICGFLLGLSLGGCATQFNLATEEEEFIMMSSNREVRLGASIAEAIERKYKTIKDERLKERVDRIGQKLVSVCDRKDIVYHFDILDIDELNAVSLPGGYVYINRGLLERLQTDDELASVLAHEIAHIAARHSVKRLQGSLGYGLLRILLGGALKEAQAVRAADMAFVQLTMAYSREDEFLADKLAVKYLRGAGYDPEAMVNFFERLLEIKRKEPLRPKSAFRTHPYLPERIAMAKKEIYGSIPFEDYINIIKE